ncbi:MAG: sulfotransferase family protein [Limisphaerales bacterium]
MSEFAGPNFFIIGAAKAATTSLSSLLIWHPEAGIVRGKEPHFFSYDAEFGQGLGRYLALFSHCRDKKACGDASTSYSRIRYYPTVVERIYRYAPNAKIIYMVRHPLKRMESAYIEHLCTRESGVFPSINEAVKRQPMIVDSSRYGEVYEAYRRRFGESQIKVVWFEEYVAQKAAVYQDVCRFLGICDTVIPDSSRESINGSGEAEQRMGRIGRSKIKVNTEWDEETRRWVIHQIRDDNCRFLDQMGRRRDYWGDLFDA